MDRANQFSRTWDEAQELKEELVRRAGVGELTGAEADAMAERLGLGRLSTKPDPDQFDPATELHWTLPMAVAWIAYRDFGEVREWSAPYRAECSDWHWRQWRDGPDGPIHEGWHLEQRRPPTLSLLGRVAAFDQADDNNTILMDVRDVQRALWEALREGFLAASGVDMDLGVRIEIPALDWHELVAVEGRGNTDEMRRGIVDSGGYTDVLIPSAPLRRFWRPPREKRLTLPRTVPPVGDGYMPLYCAVQWIATRGATIDFDPQDESIWRAAYGELLAAISSDKVRVVGTRYGQRKVLPGYLFAGCEVDYPFGNAEFAMTTSEHLYLRSCPYIDEQHWRSGHDDALSNRWEEYWTRLMVEKADVRARWPFPDAGFEDADMGTGLPGRPAKSKHLIEDEFRHRAAAGELADSLGEEANALLAWLRAMHSNHPPPTVHTIENNIRDEYRRLKPTK